MSIHTPRTQDPVCGMIVPLASEHHLERDGEIFCFCSAHCQQKYLRSFGEPFAAPIDVETESSVR